MLLGLAPLSLAYLQLFELLSTTTPPGPTGKKYVAGISSLVFGLFAALRATAWPKSSNLLHFKELEARAGVEPAFTALQAAA